MPARKSSSQILACYTVGGFGLIHQNVDYPKPSAPVLTTSLAELNVLLANFITCKYGVHISG